MIFGSQTWQQRSPLSGVVAVIVWKWVVKVVVGWFWSCDCPRMIATVLLSNRPCAARTRSTVAPQEQGATSLAPSACRHRSSSPWRTKFQPPGDRSTQVSRSGSDRLYADDALLTVASLCFPRGVCNMTNMTRATDANMLMLALGNQRFPMIPQV